MKVIYIMLLISFCALFCIIILHYGMRQSYFVSSPIGLDSQFIVCAPKDTLIAFCVILVFVSTMRYGFIDTYAYKYLYQEVRFNPTFITKGLWHIEAGWLYVMYFLNFISASPKLMLFLSALVIVGAYVKIIKDYSADVIVSLFLFFCLSYLDTNNGLRQMVAAAITMLAVPLLLKKRFFYYACCIAIAYQMHNSAIVCAVIGVTVLGKPLNIRIKCFFLGALVFVFGSGMISGLLKKLFEDNKYSFYLDMNNGMSFLRALITGIIPAFLAGMYLHVSKLENRQIYSTEAFLINMVFVNTAFILMGFRMQYWNRFSFYTQFAPIVILPKLVCSFFTEKQYAQTFRTLMMLFYFVFFVYNVYVNYSYGALDKFYLDFSF